MHKREEQEAVVARLPHLVHTNNLCWRNSVAQMTAQALTDQICSPSTIDCDYKAHASVRLAQKIVTLRAKNTGLTRKDERELQNIAKEAETETFKTASNLTQYEQNDAFEGFMHTIANLQHDKTAKNHCEDFKIHLKDSSFCMKCGSLTNRGTRSIENYELLLDVPVKKSPIGLHDLLQETFGFTANLYNKDPLAACGHREETSIIVQQLLENPPVNMMLYLNRFGDEKNPGRKVKTQVRFPMELDLTPYATTKGMVGNWILTLSGVIWHQGATLKSGHYTTTTFIPLSTGGGNWVKCDDIGGACKLEEEDWWIPKKGATTVALLYTRSKSPVEKRHNPCAV
jgi:hypothetical protein